MEFILTPDALIVAGRGVENATLALGSGPGPGLGFGDVILTLRFPNHEDLTVVRLLGVDVGFIPSAEFFDVLHGGMIGSDDGGRELLTLVVGEFPAYELGEPWFVAEAGAGAVNRDEAAAFFDKAVEVLELGRTHLIVIGVEEHAIEAGEVIVITQGFFDIGVVIEVDALSSRGLCEHREILV